MLEIKKIIEPQIDGLFTIYDSDADLMAQFQQTLPVEKQIQPIEVTVIDCATSMLSNIIIAFFYYCFHC